MVVVVPGGDSQVKYQQVTKIAHQFLTKSSILLEGVKTFVSTSGQFCFLGIVHLVKESKIFLEPLNKIADNGIFVLGFVFFTS